MNIFYSTHFKRSFKKFSMDVHQKFKKQITYLLHDFNHPSLRTKKYDEARGVWQARVDKNIRFYFLIEENRYHLLDITKHSK